MLPSPCGWGGGSGLGRAACPARLRDAETVAGAGGGEGSPRDGRDPGPPAHSLLQNSEVAWLFGGALGCMVPSPGHVEELGLG